MGHTDQSLVGVVPVHCGTNSALTTSLHLGPLMLQEGDVNGDSGWLFGSAEDGERGPP